MQKSLSDSLVLVRQYEIGDVPGLHAAVTESVRELSPWLPWCHPNYSLDEAEGFVRTRKRAWEVNEEFSFAVLDATQGTFLGGVGINQVNVTHRVGSLGYWIRTSRVRQGLATAACRLAARFAFEQLRFNRLQILMEPSNYGSIHVAEKLGAMREGYLRRRLIINSAPHDALLYAILPEDLDLKPFDAGPPMESEPA